VLSQQQEDSSWKPVAYLSKAMNETERNYEIYDRELLAIMEGLKQWRQYLIGNNQFEIWTDHKNLGYFKKPQKLNCCQAQWTTELQEYNFQLVHKPGSSQKKVDMLSRKPDHSQGKSDNEDQTVLKEEWFRNITTQEGEFWKEIEEAEEFAEEEVRKVVTRSEEGWRREGKVILWKERIYIPDSATLREEIVTRHHNSELAGHPGYTKMYELITRNYWWSQMLEDIKRYVAGCEKCQVNKPN